MEELQPKSEWVEVKEMKENRRKARGRIPVLSWAAGWDWQVMGLHPFEFQVSDFATNRELDQN
jgi:hypothetical protein